MQTIMSSPSPGKARGSNAVQDNKTKSVRNKTGSHSRSSFKVKQFRIILGAVILLNVIVLITIHCNTASNQKRSSASSSRLDHSFNIPRKSDQSKLPKTRIATDGDFTLVGNGPFMEYSKENLWDASATLPNWMKEYMVWHQDQVKTLTRETFKSKKFLIMSCTKNDNACGGTADRLRPVPVMVLIASLTKRILMIRWERPCKLEEFLLPPKGGLDWRVPSWMQSDVPRAPVMASINRIEKVSNDSRRQIVLTRYQSHHYGEQSFYERLHNATSYGDIFHDLWRIMFTPVPSIAQIIKQTMDDMNMQPGKYIGAHVRGLYIHNKRSQNQIEKITHFALNCASKLSEPHSNTTIYFASDTKHASIYAHDWERKMVSSSKKHRVATIRQDDHPLHLEKAKNWEQRHPSEYYSAFRDIYILGQSQCMSYGHGGYGSWGSILSYNWKCQHQYVNPEMNLHDSFVPCDDIHVDTYANELNLVKQSLPTLLLPINYTRTKSDSLRSRTAQIENNNTEEIMVPNIETTLPRWLVEYFLWHRDQREVLTEDNWRDYKFIVMYCGESKCGGAADRLKSIPSILLIAAITKRIFFIHWTRPCNLEEFLVPPLANNNNSKAKHDKIIGIDWRLPPFLISELNNPTRWIRPLFDRSKREEVTVVVSSVQPIDYGRSFFNRTLSEDSLSSLGYVEELTEYETFYGEMFHALFAPSSFVAKEIAQKSAELGLVAGNYTAAHLRALYARENRPFRQIEKMTTNALNCASNLQPGSTIYFAADTKVSLDIAQEYARNYSRPIAVWPRDATPLHLEFGSSRNPSDYYETFIDLYLLANSNCIAYSLGGFARWASLISFNPNNVKLQSSSSSCTLQHFERKQIQECTWADQNGPPVKPGKWYRLSNAIPN